MTRAVGRRCPTCGPRHPTRRKRRRRPPTGHPVWRRARIPRRRRRTRPSSCRPRRPTRRRWLPLFAGTLSPGTIRRRHRTATAEILSSNRQVRIHHHCLLYRADRELFFLPFVPNCGSWTWFFAGQDVSSRRDNNPFSFKAFLKNGTQQTNYHNTGARPKVYSSTTSSPGSVLDKDNVGGSVYSGRNPTELPDFVQDHLVIEQCYLNHENSQPILPDVDNLPDFALNSMEQRQSRLRSETKKNDSDVLCDDLRSFDLTTRLHKGLSHRDQSASNAMHSNHLDLPIFEDRLNETAPILPRPEHRGILHAFHFLNNCYYTIVLTKFMITRGIIFIEFPFDLPFPNSNLSINTTTRDDLPSGGEANIHKSLPDFLSDGPIHNRSTDPEPIVSMAESTERRVRLLCN